MDYLKLVNYASNQYKSSFYTIPDEGFELRMLINKYKTMLGQDMFSRFVNMDLSKTNILFRTHISSSRRFLEVKKQIEDFVTKTFPNFIQIQVTGLGIVISQSSHLLTIGQIKSLTITLILIFGMMLLLFLSGKAALVALLPNCFPIVVNFGLMGWLGIDLSLATALIASIAIGLAIDDTIHYLVRYNREFKKDLDKDRALSDTIRKIGKPIVFTTISICAGFSVLALSHFKPTSVFGLMMVVIMISALIGDLILLPCLMLNVELITAWDLLKLIPAQIALPASVAHELKQPLNTIKMGSEFLRMVAQNREEIPRDQVLRVVDEMSSQVYRAAEIINSLTVFEHRPEISRKEMDINEAVRDVVRIVDHQLHLDNIELKLDLDSNLPLIFGHRNRLGQLIFNLINNAKEAINEKDSTSFPQEVRQISIRSYREKNGVTLVVSDSGVGIPNSIKNRIFEPFFTTKELGKGRGLGLSIVNQIVKDYGGQISFETKEHVGTTFKISFPLTQENSF